jgi:DNA-binding ferritin-like protein (Dps family)
MTTRKSTKGQTIEWQQEKVQKDRHFFHRDIKKYMWNSNAEWQDYRFVLNIIYEKEWLLLPIYDTHVTNHNHNI